MFISNSNTEIKAEFAKQSDLDSTYSSLCKVKGSQMLLRVSLHRNPTGLQ